MTVVGRPGSGGHSRQVFIGSAAPDPDRLRYKQVCIPNDLQERGERLAQREWRLVTLTVTLDWPFGDPSEHEFALVSDGC